MIRKSKPHDDKPGFRELIPNYTDEELTEILKKRRHYQPEAAELAVNEAIKRGIVKNQEDLSMPEFQENPPEKFRFFPVIDDEKNRTKIRKSISRMLILAGIIPLIFGVRMMQNSWEWGILFMVYGFIWMIPAFMIFRRYDQRMVKVLFILFFLSFLYVVILFVTSGFTGFSDFFAALVFYLLFGYGLLFLRRVGA